LNADCSKLKELNDRLWQMLCNQALHTITKFVTINKTCASNKMVIGMWQTKYSKSNQSPLRFEKGNTFAADILNGRQTVANWRIDSQQQPNPEAF